MPNLSKHPQSEFLSHLRSEKEKSQATRTDYTMRKLTFVTALLGLGSIDLTKVSQNPLVDVTTLLYIIPYVALAFDLYIMGEDYGIKRIGSFLKSWSFDPAEEQWEALVSQNRDWMSPLAMPLLTSLITGASAWMLYLRRGSTLGQEFWIWLGVTIVLIWGLFAVYLGLRRKIENMVLKGLFKKTALQKYKSYWLPLRSDVEGANRTLSRLVFERARKIFLDHYAKGSESPLELTEEYEKDEFLLVVDRDGNPSGPVLNMLDLVDDTTRKHPDFARWFKVGILQEGKYTGEPVILAARWLCHLVGLRHGTVEIFIDPPDRPGYTLVQVRGMDKFEAPGAFDIPCAGHISGTDTVEDSLKKELSEELNLNLEDLCDLQMLTRYNSFADEEEPALGPVNYEHRVLYRASLKPEAADKIHFTDGEVAGLTVFAVHELRELVRRYPERVASGLSDAIGYYG